MKNVILIELKRWYPTLIVYSIIALFIILLAAIFGSSIYLSSYTVVAFVLGLAILLAFLAFTPNKRKATGDFYFSLPISKKHLFLGRMLFILLVFLVLLLVYSLFGLLFTVIISNTRSYSFITNKMIIKYLFVFIPLLFVTCLSLIVFTSYILYKANTISDGIIHLALVALIWSLSSAFIYTIVKNHFNLNNFSYIACNYVMPFSLLDVIFIEDEVSIYLVYGFPLYVTCMVLNSFISYLAIIPLYFLHKHDSAERIEEIDNSWLSYKLLNPIIYILLVLYFCIAIESFGLSLTLIVLFTAGLYVLYMLQNKSFKLTMKQLLIIISLFILALIYISIICFTPLGIENPNSFIF